MLEDFTPDCTSCGEEVGTHPSRYSVALPTESAREIGMMASYLVECDECGEVTGGFLDTGQLEYLMNRACSISGHFGVPTSQDVYPAGLPRITRAELMLTSVRLRFLGGAATWIILQGLRSSS